MTGYSEQLLKHTIEVWQSYSPEPLSLDDAQEIIDNTIRLYSYLFELKQKYDQKET